MMTQLGWESLAERRAKAKATMMYRAVHGLVCIQVWSYLTPVISATRENTVKFFIQYCRTTTQCSTPSSRIQPECGHIFLMFVGGHTHLPQRLKICIYITEIIFYANMYITKYVGKFLSLLSIIFISSL